MIVINKSEKKILVIIAHPDDAEIWAGGTISKYSNTNQILILVGCEDTNRLKEAQKSSSILGAKLLTFKKITLKICIDTIQKYRPEIILTHNPFDCHFEHRQIFEVVNNSIILTAIKFKVPKKLCSLDTYNSTFLTTVLSNYVIIDITENYQKKIESIKCHKSQPIEHFVAMANRMTLFWGGLIGVDRGERFFQLPILGFYDKNQEL